LLALWALLADDGPQQADAFLARLAQQLRRLAKHPSRGCERPDLGCSVRSYPLGGYHIYFRATAGGIEVVRVLNEACDLDGGFRAAAEQGNRPAPNFTLPAI
jgi:plasmid stabilization system protein ParE